MAPLLFDLDEFCSRVARLNEGRDIEDEDVQTPVKFHKTPPSSPGRMAKPPTPHGCRMRLLCWSSSRPSLAGGIGARPTLRDEPISWRGENLTLEGLPAVRDVISSDETTIWPRLVTG